MSLLTDILQAFERWGEWKRMREAPARLDALEKRLAALETGTVRPDPATVLCPLCRSPMKVVATAPHPQFGVFGEEEWTYRCSAPACGKETKRSVKP